MRHHVIFLQTCGRFRLRRSRSCSGWAAAHKEPSSSASSAPRRWPSRRCESRRRRTSNTCESSSTQISSVSSMSATPAALPFFPNDVSIVWPVGAPGFRCCCFLEVSQVIHRLCFVHCRGVCTQAPCYCIIMEYCAQGQLYEVLRAGRKVTPRMLVDWASGIASGMNYLHLHKIIHRDLKSPKWVLSFCLHWKIQLGFFGGDIDLLPISDMPTLSKHLISNTKICRCFSPKLI